MNQISFDEMLYDKYKITKPIRLIELFGGVGSQAMALRNLGVEFDHYKLIEFDKYPVASYNTIHGTNFIPKDITKVTGGELNIVDTDNHEYIMTYSFPCQDLSIAGLRRGMTKGTSTRSGLLWEVERLLNESEELPQVLLMENVPQVIADANIEDFKKWQQFLESKGYKNFVKVLNAKNYGIPQNRDRCFMVSILDQNAYYKFPEKTKCLFTLNNILENSVGNEYFLTEKHIETMRNTNYKKYTYRNDTREILDGKYKGEFVVFDYRYDEGIRIRKDKTSPTITTRAFNCFSGVPLIYKDDKFRGLTPLEHWRLMGFSDDDFNSAAKVNNVLKLYKQAGNSIVVNVLEEIFKEMM